MSLIRYLREGEWIHAGRPPITADGFRLGIDKPGPTNTGVPAGTTLTTYSGSNTITTDGATFKHVRFPNDIDVRAKNVTFDECRFEGTGDGLVKATNSNVRNLLIRRCTFRPSVGNTTSIGIVGHDFISTRNDISGTVDGIRVHNTSAPDDSSRVSIVGDWIHDLCYTTPYAGHGDNETHNDCIQIEGGQDTLIRGNFLSARGDSEYGNIDDNARAPYVLSCLIVTPNVGVVHGLTITENWFDGGYVPLNIGQASRGPIELIGLRDNRFSGQKAASPGHDALIPATTKAVNNQDLWTGNIREDTGQPLVIGNG